MQPVLLAAGDVEKRSWQRDVNQLSALLNAVVATHPERAGGLPFLLVFYVAACYALAGTRGDRDMAGDASGS